MRDDTSFMPFLQEGTAPLRWAFIPFCGNFGTFIQIVRNLAEMLETARNRTDSHLSVARCIGQPSGDTRRYDRRNVNRLFHTSSAELLIQIR